MARLLGKDVLSRDRRERGATGASGGGMFSFNPPGRAMIEVSPTIEPDRRY